MLIGAMGDYLGLGQAIWWSAFIVFLSVPVVFLLPGVERDRSGIADS
jgi:hypothetical protein